jgi:ABC-type polysaccharide/polyol phosphate transport system ATPase subunit
MKLLTWPKWNNFSTRPLNIIRAECICASPLAVAANLEPEVLIVDEVLAVGDAEFQKNAWAK